MSDREKIYSVPSLRGGLHLKGERRMKKDELRREKGVSAELRLRDRTPHCHYTPEGPKPLREKSRASAGKRGKR